ITMQRKPKQRRELAVKMKLGKSGDSTHRFQVEVTLEMPVDVIQHSLHPLVIGVQISRHPYSFVTVPICSSTRESRSTDLAVLIEQLRKMVGPPGLEPGTRPL